MNCCKSHQPLIPVREDSGESITSHIRRPNDSQRELVNKFTLQTIFLCLWFFLQHWGFKGYTSDLHTLLWGHQFLNPISGGLKHNLSLHGYCLGMSKQIYPNINPHLSVAFGTNYSNLLGPRPLVCGSRQRGAERGEAK